MARTSTRPRLSSHAGKLPSATELFSISYAYIKSNLNTFLYLQALPAIFVLWEVVSTISSGKNDHWGWFNSFGTYFLGQDFNYGSIPGGGLISLILLILIVIVSLMQTVFYLRIAEGQKPSLSTIWGEFKHIGLRLFLTQILMMISIGIGLILFLVPGLIILWRFYLTPYILIDQKTTISEAFVKSWEMTAGYAWPIYSVVLVSFALSLPNFVPVIGGVVAFVLSAIYAPAAALRYVQLKRSNG